MRFTSKGVVVGTCWTEDDGVPINRIATEVERVLRNYAYADGQREESVAVPQPKRPDSL